VAIQVAALLLYLLAGSNLLHVMLVTTRGRAGELALRAALGASRARLGLALLAEWLPLLAPSAALAAGSRSFAERSLGGAAAAPGARLRPLSRSGRRCEPLTVAGVVSDLPIGAFARRVSEAAAYPTASSRSSWWRKGLRSTTAAEAGEARCRPAHACVDAPGQAASPKSSQEYSQRAVGAEAETRRSRS
jgi:hypothetical protein